jgi:SAM-dependent methyltransferase
MARRRHSKPAWFFGYEHPAHVYSIHERHREVMRLLDRFGYRPLSEIRILDVGCGDGNMLRQFLEWGALPPNLAGIDLQPEAVGRARQLSPGLDVRCGSAVYLPWPTGYFDLVCQFTVFTSVPDIDMRRRVASEMDRVLRPGKGILWYDFTYDNPSNPDVRGVKARDIRGLFPDYDVRLRRITLAPPLARRIPVGLLPVAYPLLAAIPLLCSHLIGLLIKPEIRQGLP